MNFDLPRRGHLSICDGQRRHWDICTHDVVDADGNVARTVWTASRWTWPDTLEDFLVGDGFDDSGWCHFDSSDEAIAAVHFLYGAPGGYR